MDTYLSENLTDIDTYMSTVNLDIEKFNQYFKVNVDGLKSRGDRTDDLIINIFKPYQVSSDEDFVIYIKTKRGYNLSPDELITSVLNKFETLRKDNKWNSMSPEQEQIISLASVVEKLKDDNLNLSNIFK